MSTFIQHNDSNFLGRYEVPIKADKKTLGPLFGKEDLLVPGVSPVILRMAYEVLKNFDLSQMGTRLKWKIGPRNPLRPIKFEWLRGLLTFVIPFAIAVPIYAHTLDMVQTAVAFCVGILCSILNHELYSSALKSELEDRTQEDKGHYAFCNYVAKNTGLPISEVSLDLVKAMRDDYEVNRVEIHKHWGRDLAGNLKGDRGYRPETVYTSQELEEQAYVDSRNNYFNNNDTTYMMDSSGVIVGVIGGGGAIALPSGGGYDNYDYGGGGNDSWNNNF